MLKAAQDAVAQTADKPAEVRDAVISVVERALELTEDAVDLALTLSLVSEQNGVQPEPWEKVKAERGL